MVVTRFAIYPQLHSSKHLAEACAQSCLLAYVGEEASGPSLLGPLALAPDRCDHSALKFVIGVK